LSISFASHIALVVGVTWCRWTWCAARDFPCASEHSKYHLKCCYKQTAQTYVMWTTGALTESFLLATGHVNNGVRFQLLKKVNLLPPTACRLLWTSLCSTRFRPHCWVGLKPVCSARQEWITECSKIVKISSADKFASRGVLRHRPEIAGRTTGGCPGCFLYVSNPWMWWLKIARFKLMVGRVG